jgi:CDP-glycerol glycerophosphotransferase (TagB/SpsB family)
MKTIFLTVYDGDTEKVILRTGVLEQLKREGYRIVLLIRGADRLEHYTASFASENVLVELLPKAMTKLEAIWYHIGWNTLPTRAVFIRRYERYRKHRNIARYAVECTLGFLGNFRMWRELLRLLYAVSPDSYIKNLFDTYQPDLVFTPNMFSPEDLRILRMAKRRGIRTVATAKSWDVLTTKAFTRVKADRLLVFNQFNKEEAVRLGDYHPKQVVVTGFPQFDIYARDTWKVSRKEFCASRGLDPERAIVLYAVPGDWKSPYTKETLEELDQRIEAGTFVKPIQILARLHPKYSDSSEGHQYKHIVMHRPGTLLADEKDFSIDMGISNTYQWTFTDVDIEILANSLFHSELAINTESTLTLDAAALDKPTILIGYDGGQKVPYWDSVARIYEREHYRHVTETGAAPIVYSHDELTNAINRFLENPEYLRRERQTLEENLLYKVDGNSANRTAAAILELLA